MCIPVKVLYSGYQHLDVIKLFRKYGIRCAFTCMLNLIVLACSSFHLAVLIPQACIVKEFIASRLESPAKGQSERLLILVWITMCVYLCVCVYVYCFVVCFFLS